MKETGYVLLKSGALTAEELEKINRYTRRAFQEEELYTFSVVLCDNEVDRDMERFTIPALERLGELFVGKTGIFDHAPQAQNQAARIYDCRVECLPERVTRAGEAYHRLVARAYLPRCPKNEEFILELESGIKKEVSVGCSVAEATCSICGADRRKEECGHVKGRCYDGVLCCTILDHPTDAYEWSFVAIPAQREAGVIKSFTEKGERTMEEVWKSLSGEGDLVLHAEERQQLAKEVAILREQAACGRQYREALEKSVVRLCGIVSPEVPHEAMERAAQAMQLDDLQAFEKAFRKRAAQALPLTPQLAPAEQRASTENREFQI